MIFSGNGTGIDGAMGKNLRLAKSFKSCYYMYSDSVVVGENREICSHKERGSREAK